MNKRTKWGGNRFPNLFIQVLGVQKVHSYNITNNKSIHANTVYSWYLQLISIHCAIIPHTYVTNTFLYLPQVHWGYLPDIYLVPVSHGLGDIISIYQYMGIKYQNNLQYMGLSNITIIYNIWDYEGLSMWQRRTIGWH